MLDNRVAVLLNMQVNKEFYSSYLYLDMSNYYANEGLAGFANWYKVQAQEERDHAINFMEYMHNNGQKVNLETIKKPDLIYKGHMDPLKAGLLHEQTVTSSIHDLYDAAFTLKDFRTMQYLDWFVKEQGEEEKNAEEMVKKMELFGSDPKGLYLLDIELKARQYITPVPMD